MLPCWTLAAGIFVFVAPAAASGWLDAGDVELRSDLVTVVDAGRLDLPMLGWPIPREDVCAALADPVAKSRPANAAVEAALARLLTRCAPQPSLRAYANAGDPAQLRGFAAEPRSPAEAGMVGAWEGHRWSARMAVSLHAEPQDDQSIRPDGTYLAGKTGNWLWSAGWIDRWWGPGWDGSLIWSNNARPIPGIAVDRVRSTPFQTKWLSWIGPWRATAFLGALEHDRVDVDDALFMGLRVAARPLDGLELAFSRTMQFCGDGLPCSASSVWDMLVGRDNPGADGSLDPEDEPGNQMGSVEARWSSPIGDAPYALYTQLTGEDEANFFPVKLLKLYGADGLVTVGGVPMRVYLEYADTSCASSNPGKVYNCAYNQHFFYREGYRYRGRVIGHSMDSDGLLWTLGAAWTTPTGWSLELVSRYAQINRGGANDERHTISPTPLDRYELAAGARRRYRWGLLEARLGATYDEPAGAARDLGLSGYIGFSRTVGAAGGDR